MITFTLRLQPHIAAILVSLLTTWVMTTRPRPKCGESWPTVAQQHADGIEDLLTNHALRPDQSSTINTEIVIHGKGDGNTLDDGTFAVDFVQAPAKKLAIWVTNVCDIIRLLEARRISE